MKPATSIYASSGEVREILPEAFTTLALEMPARVTYEAGSPARVLIHASEADRDRVEVTVSRGTLRLQMERQGWFRRAFSPGGTIEITVISPQLESVAVSGSGQVVAASPLQGRRVEVKIAGSGRIEGLVEAEAVSASISGSGRVTLSGTAPSADVQISGSGRMELEEVKAERVSVRISGSGRADVDASESLEVRISGSGRVTYSGSPNVNERVSGSGSVRARD